MSEQLIRLLRIITMIQAKPGIAARELAEKCETSERTIYRDLEVLSAACIPFTNKGHGQGYAYIGHFSLYPLNWTEDEAMAFSMLPAIVEHTKMLPPKFDSAFEKVMATHNKEQSRRIEITQQISDIIPMGSPAHGEDQTHFLSVILQATLSQNTIDSLYYTQSRDELSQRFIDPYYLVPRDHRFYLIGFCHTAMAVRTFRVSRFHKVQLLAETFSKDDFSLANYLKNTWSIERGEEHIHFKIKFAANIARYVKEEEMFVKPKLTDLPDGRLLFEVTINSDREFLGWLAQYGSDAEIVAPLAYRDQMKQHLEQWSRIYR